LMSSAKRGRTGGVFRAGSSRGAIRRSRGTHERFIALSPELFVRNDANYDK
jgi:hypothetical protein